MAARIAGDARVASGVERPLPASQWGMGTTLWPLATSHLRNALGCQGGIRVPAAYLLPEDELVIAPAARRLTMPPGARDYCGRKHFGFCKTRDADIADRVACIHNALVKVSQPLEAGNFCFGFILQMAPTRGAGHLMFTSRLLLCDRTRSIVRCSLTGRPSITNKHVHTHIRGHIHTTSIQTHKHVHTRTHTNTS